MNANLTNPACGPVLFKNGSGGYVEAEEARGRGYDFNGYHLYHQGVRFNPIKAIEIDPASLPKNEAGERVLDGVLCSETGRFYRAAA